MTNKFAMVILAGIHLPATALQLPTKCRCNNLQKLFLQFYVKSACKKHVSHFLNALRKLLTPDLLHPNCLAISASDMFRA